jgi:hypothetical protein
MNEYVVEFVWGLKARRQTVVADSFAEAEREVREAFGGPVVVYSIVLAEPPE